MPPFVFLFKLAKICPSSRSSNRVEVSLGPGRISRSFWAFPGACFVVNNVISRSSLFADVNKASRMGTGEERSFLSPASSCLDLVRHGQELPMPRSIFRREPGPSTREPCGGAPRRKHNPSRPRIRRHQRTHTQACCTNQNVPWEKWEGRTVVRMSLRELQIRAVLRVQEVPQIVCAVEKRVMSWHQGTFARMTSHTLSKRRSLRNPTRPDVPR